MMSGGWNPTVHLASQSGTRLAWDESLATFIPGDAAAHQTSAGAAAGTFGLAECLRSGTLAGAEAAARAGFDGEPPAVPQVEGDTGDGALDLEPFWHRPASPRDGKAFHDLQNDVTTADVALATRENYVSVEHFKRYTTTGMGTDQGKTSNVNGLAILADDERRGHPFPGSATRRTGPSTPRSPSAPLPESTPEATSTIRSARRPCTPGTPKQRRALRGRRPVEAPLLLPQARRIRRRGGAARNPRRAHRSIGILDASTLGKIDVQGKPTRRRSSTASTPTCSRP